MTQHRHPTHTEKPLFEELRAHIFLTEDEKSRGKMVLLALMENNRTSRAGSIASSPSPHMLSATWRYFIALLAGVVVVGGSTVSAAAYAMPGDSLYPIKIHVTEEIPSLFVWSPKIRAQMSAERLSERMAEHVLMSAYPTPAALEDLRLLTEATVDGMIEAQDDIEELANMEQEIIAASIADEIASTADVYESHLRNHSAVAINGSAAQVSTIGDAMTALQEKLMDEAIKNGTPAENALETVEVIEEADADLEDVKELLTESHSSMHSEAIDAIAEAEQTLADAKSASQIGNTVEALDYVEETRDAIESAEAAVDIDDLSADYTEFNAALPRPR